jgi:CRISPR-associated protein Csm2
MAHQPNPPRGYPQQRDERPAFNEAQATQGIIFGKEISAELFNEIAQEKARMVAEAGKGGRSGKLEKNKSTQLRRFYDDLVMWNDRVQAELIPADRDRKYTELAPYIKMLNAKVAYAKGRGHVEDTFAAIYSRCIKQIQDAETLKHGKLFIEAFMGFYKAEEK